MRDLRRAAYDRERGRCLVTGAPLGHPDASTWELHHRVPGGQGGTPWDRDILSNVIAVTPRVHNLDPRSIHGSPSWSFPLGYLLPAREREPWTVPVLHWSGWWVTLDDEGRYVGTGRFEGREAPPSADRAPF